MKRIEFIDGEPYCRFDGVLMGPEESKKLYGLEDEFDILDVNTYQIYDTIYTDKKFNELIKLLGEVHGEVEEYDVISSRGLGYEQHCHEAQLNNTVVISLRSIEYVENVKPFMEYKKDYPNLNVEKYIEFMDCLDEYYNGLK